MKRYKFFRVTEKGTLIGPYSHKMYKHGRKRTPPIERLKMCRSGWHVWKSERTARLYMRDIIRGHKFALYEVSCLGKRVDGGMKEAWESIRLVRLIGVYRAGYGYRLRKLK